MVVGARHWKGVFILWIVGLVSFPVATVLVLVWDTPVLAITILTVNMVVLVRMITPPDGGHRHQPGP